MKLPIRLHRSCNRPGEKHQRDRCREAPVSKETVRQEFSSCGAGGTPEAPLRIQIFHRTLVLCLDKRNPRGNLASAAVQNAERSKIRLGSVQPRQLPPKPCMRQPKVVTHDVYGPAYYRSRLFRCHASEVAHLDQVSE